MKKEKRELIKRTAEKFILIDEDSKNFIAGYMAGKAEEKAKWEQKLQTA